MEKEEETHRENDCRCMEVIGHLENARLAQTPRRYKPSRGYLRLGDWTQNPFLWMHYVPSGNVFMFPDQVLNVNDPKYYGVHDPQRHFVGDLHCEQALFTFQYPNLQMPTMHGTHLFKLNAATKNEPQVHIKELNRSLEITMKKMVMHDLQFERIVISDQLIKLRNMDKFKRKCFLQYLSYILSLQDDLQLFSLENFNCKRLEGVRLLKNVSLFNAESLKYLFLWRFVEQNENPVLINNSYLKGVYYTRMLQYFFKRKDYQ